MDFGHFLVNHTEEEKIEVGSVPSGPNVGVELFGRGGGVKVGKALPETGPLPHLFWASTLFHNSSGQNRLELKKAGAGGGEFFPPEAPLRRGGVGRSGRWAKNLDGSL